MGEKFEVLATNSMGDDMFIATPAVTGKSMYLRGAARCTVSSRALLQR